MRSVVSLVLAGLSACIFQGWAHAQQAERPIEKLMSEGWEVVNFTAAQERRSLVLFKHKDHKYLMQCSVLVDVMRKPAVVTACYELR